MERGQGTGAVSPPTARVVDVVETLAGRPDARWTLTDLARATGMTRATAHAVLTTLADRGWVHRDDADKSYAVGPYLAVLGRALAATRPLEQLAHDAAAKLAVEHGHTTVVVHLVNDAVVVTDVVPPPGVHSAIAVGNKVPYLPPFGPGFVAWAPADEQQTWLEHARRINPGLGERLEAVLPAVRRRGYSLERADDAARAAYEVLGRLQDDVFGAAVREILGRVLLDLTRVDYLGSELRPGRHRVASIAAPVFDERGRVVLNLAVQPRGEFSGAELRALGESVARAADGVTTATGGRRP
jgi:DNA-binding IclR family transcriptional regulator